jgi:hypothetical protein
MGYTFTAYFEMLPVTQIWRRRVVRWLVDNELEKCEREQSWPNLRYRPGFVWRYWIKPRKPSARIVCSLRDFRLSPRCEIFAVKKNSSWTAWPLKMGSIGCFETSVWHYHSRLRKIPEERRSLVCSRLRFWSWGHANKMQERQPLGCDVRWNIRPLNDSDNHTHQLV